MEMSTNRNSDVAIEAENLGKRYRIFENPKDRLKQAVWRGRRKYYHEFWALRNITFQVRRGETLGIIGRNGSGKSTLLQMICGTLSPSEGTVRTNGKVAALLELGSGFNPEFTGLENVYLNGSLLGLTQADIDNRLDSILAFADIGEFIQQPVKFYSSGMALRLAFAVLAHSDPEILVVDEALAVGDAAFGQKCMRFIQGIRDNHVLLYVSHDPASIATLCDRALWIDAGRERSRGDVRMVLDQYSKDCYARMQETDFGAKVSAGEKTLETGDAKATSDGLKPTKEGAPELTGSKTSLPYANAVKISSYTDAGFGDGAILIREVALLNPEAPNDGIKLLKGGERVKLSVLAECIRSQHSPSICGFIFRNKLGLTLFGENTFKPGDPHGGPTPSAGDWLQVDFDFQMPCLQSGTYTISLGWASGTQHDHVQNCYINDAVEVTSNADAYRPMHGLFACTMNGLSIHIN
jgi:lipopolysaccharide transport system ATP-binding protein